LPELEVRNLTKRYGKTIAVDDLSFSVQAGHVTGFLGPNEAGKTTTMRALLGLVWPSSGEALVEAAPPVAMRDPLRTIGSLHGNPEGDANLSQVEGGLVLSAWAGALVALGTLLICRRDVAE
jgi:ABC-type multidrug transport system ATPase subunit